MPNKRETRKFCTKLIKRNLPGWGFGYHKHTRNLGRTSHRHKKITLYHKLAESDNKYVLRNIIKHEIAHAKSTRAGHGKTWLTEAKKLKTAKWARKKGLKIAKIKGSYYIQE